jgi:hypothetical protein
MAAPRLLFESLGGVTSGLGRAHRDEANHTAVLLAQPIRANPDREEPRASPNGQ